MIDKLQQTLNAHNYYGILILAKMNNAGHNNNQNSWSDAWPALSLLLLHTVCCIGIALFVLLGGAGLSALLASKGFWAIAIGVLTGSIAGYWYYQQNQYRSCKSSNTNKRDQSAKIHTN